jgi:hypothetical protein
LAARYRASRLTLIQTGITLFPDLTGCDPRQRGVRKLPDATLTNREFRPQYSARQENGMMSNQSLRHCLFSFAVMICLSGCGGSDRSPQGSVAGIVTVSGEPVTEGEVLLISKITGQSGQGSLTSDGTFRIAALPAGEYVVTISPPVVEYPPGGDGPDVAPPVTSKIPKKFWSDTSSDLVVQVQEGSNDLSWELAPR